MYVVTATLYIESVTRRTNCAMGSFDTLPEALEYIAREYPDGLQEGETFHIDCTN